MISLHVNYYHKNFGILNQPPYEYDDGVYYIAKIENRFLINDTMLEVNVLPLVDKFFNLINQWKLVIAKKPHHIYISIDNQYNFEIVPSQVVSQNVF